MDKQNYLIQQFNNYGITINGDQADKLVKFYDLVFQTNEVMNLTAITEWEEFVTKHYIDSCITYKLFNVGSTVVDVGAGAGFPSIPLKIVRPDLNITMIDSLQKRVNFLNVAINELGLQNIKAEHHRAEEYVIVSRETFDYAIARAVAQMNTLSEYCLPLVKVGGKFVAYKANVDTELADSQYAIQILGGKVDGVDKYEIGGDSRSIVVVQKVAKTPAKYPRGQNKPRTMPLMSK